MCCNIRPVTLLYWGLCGALVFGMVGGCSPQHYKDEADEQVYKIIDSKWHESFGQKANYIVSDSDLAPSSNEIRVDEVPAPPDAMTLAQAVAVATANNRNYQNQKENLYLSALALTGIRHDYERRWFATIDGAYVDDSVNDDEFFLGSSIATTQDFILPSGIIISTSLAVEWLRFLTGDPSTSLGSVLTASVAVPLLGAGAGKQKWEDLLQTERQVLYDIRSFNRFRKIFVVETINDYYGVLQERDAVTNAENDYNRRVESKERLEWLAKAGRRPPFEVDQAEQDMLAASDRYVAAQQRYERALDDLKIRLGLPTDIDIELDQNELKALEEMGITEPAFTVDAAIETALLQRLDLANAADQIDDALRKAVLAADGLGPQINLNSRIAPDNASNNIRFTSPEGETDFQNLRFHEGMYDFGFDVDLPLERLEQRNTYRIALIALERQQRQYELDADVLKLQVRDAHRLLLETAERYRIQKNSLELAERRVDSTRLLLDAGRATTRDLLDSQDDLLIAQNAVTAALVAHLDAKLSFFRDVGILQVRPDGMWIEQGHTKLMQ
ncbi:MAG: TolC family protein [Planctomycetota bacterium]|nr:MAG: TolC family protein [Planctomycetota bacterium]